MGMGHKLSGAGTAEVQQSDATARWGPHSSPRGLGSKQRKAIR